MDLYPGQQYLDALNKLNAARQQVEDLGAYLIQVGTAMRKDPLTFHVSDVHPKPIVPLAGYTYDLHPAKWPTAEQIAEKVTALQDAYFRAEYAWFHLSPSEKTSLPRFKVR